MTASGTAAGPSRPTRQLTYWNQAGGPFKDGLNETRKYVASSSRDTDLPWPNSTLLSGDVPAGVLMATYQPA